MILIRGDIRLYGWGLQCLLYTFLPSSLLLYLFLSLIRCSSFDGGGGARSPSFPLHLRHCCQSGTHQISANIHILLSETRANAIYRNRIFKITFPRLGVSLESEFPKKRYQQPRERNTGTDSFYFAHCFGNGRGLLMAIRFANRWRAFLCGSCCYCELPLEFWAIITSKIIGQCSVLDEEVEPGGIGNYGKTPYFFGLFLAGSSAIVKQQYYWQIYIFSFWKGALKRKQRWERERVREESKGVRE